MHENVLILSENTSLEKAVQLLDLNGNGVLPVLDNEGVFVGLITDGDIRKAILNKNLDLLHIINKNPYKMNIASSVDERILYLKRIERRQLPLVDNENRYIEMFTFDSLEFNLKPNKVVIMAGGLGSRLGNLTQDTPKPMLKVGGKPILELIINNFALYGFTNFFISVGYLSHVIKEYFEDGRKFGVNITYIEEEQKLGTAGSLSLINDSFTDPLIVTNGDILTTADFSKILKFHSQKNATATMCTRSMSYKIDYGVVEECDDKFIGIKEKPEEKFSINAGIYVLSPSVLQTLKKNSYLDMPTLFQEITNCFTFKIDDYWIDIGQREHYYQVIQDSELDIRGHA